MSGTLRSDNISLLEQTLSLVYNSRYSNRKHYSVIAENKIDIGEPKNVYKGYLGICRECITMTSIDVGRDCALLTEVDVIGSGKDCD